MEKMLISLPGLSPLYRSQKSISWLDAMIWNVSFPSELFAYVPIVVNRA